MAATSQAGEGFEGSEPEKMPVDKVEVGEQSPDVCLLKDSISSGESRSSHEGSMTEV